MLKEDREEDKKNPSENIALRKDSINRMEDYVPAE
jgi:hypothetical protein